MLPSASTVDNARLVLHIDALLLSFAALCLVLALPRTIVWLLHTHFVPPGRRASRLSRPSQDGSSQITMQGDSEATDGDAEKPPVSRSPRFPHIHRVPAYSTYLPYFASFLRRSIVPGFSIGQLALLAGYTGVLLYAAFYHADPFVDHKRYGWVAGSQLPLVVALAMRNSPAGWVGRWSAERLNYIHRWAGRLLIIAANIHGIGFLAQFSYQGTFGARFDQPFVAWGFTALVVLDVLGALSTSYVRRHWWNVFAASHIILVIVVLVALHFHRAALAPYIYAATALLIFDFLFRLLRTRPARATLTPLPGGSVRVNLQLSGPRTAWSARVGQHVQLRVLTTHGMGAAGWAEAHPFSVASTPGDGEAGREDMALIVKGAGGWTRRLVRLAKQGYGQREGDETGGRPVRVRCLVEGPYGGLAVTRPAVFSVVCIFAGGSGISFALSLLAELVHADARGGGDGCALRVIELAWSISGPAIATPFIPQLAALVGIARRADVRVSLFYTRALIAGEEDMLESLPVGITLAPGRTPTAAILHDALERTVGHADKVDERSRTGEKLSGALVAVCGPLPMCEGVARAVGGVDGKLRKTIGGVELHREIFGV